MIFAFTFLFGGILHAADGNFLEELRRKHLPAGAVYDATKSQQIEDMMKSVTKKGGSAGKRERADKPKRSELYYFRISSNFETAKQRMTTKGLQFVEWDKQRLKREQKKGAGKNKFKPLEMPDYRQASASENNDLFILSTHFLNLETREWQRGVNLQVVHQEP
ncbi:MAG: hypothetical protein HYT76_08985 [Deltaproteobacteria bacterium]|nr:hypothetical protein [Deltaproteobacteria bacterium]